MCGMANVFGMAPLLLLFLTNSYILKKKKEKRKNYTRVDRARNIAAFPTIIAHVSRDRAWNPFFYEYPLHVRSALVNVSCYFTRRI